MKKFEAFTTALTGICQAFGVAIEIDYADSITLVDAAGGQAWGVEYDGRQHHLISGAPRSTEQSLKERIRDLESQLEWEREQRYYGMES